MSVHIVFAEYIRRIDLQPGPRQRSVWSLLVSLHRRLYYRLITFLERRAYNNPRITLILIARRTADALQEHYGRREACPVLYVGLDHEVFNTDRRALLHRKARKDLGLDEKRFVLLLIGNDWRNKGIPVLLDAMAELRNPEIELLYVSSEDLAPLHEMASARSLDGRVRAIRPRKDVESFYAAADAYVGASLEDTFALPPAEAMACGLPVIVSAANGTSEIITDGVDGLILDDPRDAVGLAAMIRRLYEDEAFRTQLGEKAAETARQYTWERNGREIAAIFEEVLRRKNGAQVHQNSRGKQT